MNILILTQRWHPDSFSGSFRTASEQARRLAKKGHEVTVLCERFDDGLQPIEKTANLTVYRYGNARAISKIGGSSRSALKYIPPLIKSLQNKGERWDVAVLHHPFSAGGFYAAKTGLPVMYMFHASTKREVEIEGVARKFIWPINKIASFVFAHWVGGIEASVLRQANHIAVHTDFSERILIETYPFTLGKISHLSIGVDCPQFEISKNDARTKLQLNDNDKIILTVRRLTPRMGLSVLIEAVKTARSKYDNIKLVIVGEGPLRATIEKIVAENSLENHVSLVGRVSDAELEYYYRAADLFVLPTIAFEGLGVSTLEALARGLSVVGTPAGATPEVLSKVDTQLICAGTNPDDVANKIIEYFGLPDFERIDLSIRGKKAVAEHFNWEVEMNKMEMILSNLIRK